MAKTTDRPIGGAGPLKVRATAMGYFDLARRRIGDVFVIPDESYFSTRWMERVPEDPPVGITSSHDEIVFGRTPDRRPAADEDDEGPTS